jgi:serine/threonine protein kinase
VLTLLL